MALAPSSSVLTPGRTMPKCPVSNEALSLYYDLWIKGSTFSKMCQELRKSGLITERGNIRYRTMAKFKERILELTPYFLLYCRDRVRRETRSSLANGGTTVEIALTPQRREELLNHLGSGLDMAAASLLMNIPLPTITDRWFKEDPTLQMHCKYAAEINNAEVVKALFKRAKGYTYLEQSETNSSGDNLPRKDAEGNVGGCYTSKTITVKHIEGSVTAQKFWLVNKVPDEWTMDGTNPRKNNKGRILEAIDAMTAVTKEELEEMDNE